jgi:hypothetical protein
VNTAHRLAGTAGEEVTISFYPVSSFLAHRRICVLQGHSTTLLKLCEGYAQGITTPKANQAKNVKKQKNLKKF